MRLWRVFVLLSLASCTVSPMVHFPKEEILPTPSKEIVIIAPRLSKHAYLRVTCEEGHLDERQQIIAALDCLKALQ